VTELDESDLRRIFEEDVIPRLRVTDPQPQDRPELVVVGGQPGAGKSTAMTYFAKQLTDHGGLVVVSMDDYRPFYPEYNRLLAQDDTAMAAATRPAAYRWQTMAAEWLRNNHYNVAFEAGFRDPGAVMDTVERYSAAGYRVQVVALAVPSGVSRVGIIQRYAHQREVAGAGRWTTRQSHDSDYAGSVKVRKGQTPLPLWIALSCLTARE
jgi:predicted ABC-type ATPase